MWTLEMIPRMKTKSVLKWQISKKWWEREAAARMTLFQ